MTNATARQQRALQRVLRLRELEDTVGLKRSSIYEAIEAGTFPQPVRLAPRAVGWLASEVEAWIESRTRAREA
jgi:prophage regulatory protein